MQRHLRWIATVLAVAIALLCGGALAESPADYNRNVPQMLKEGHLYAQSAILVDATSGDVLFSKNARARMYPASTTKVMTLLLALESGIAMDTPIVIPQAAAQIPADSSLIPVFPGDMMTFRDLLYGFMLTSGNDGANAIAVLVSGNVDAFVERMNRRARELGCEGHPLCQLPMATTIPSTIPPPSTWPASPARGSSWTPSGGSPPRPATS